MATAVTDPIEPGGSKRRRRHARREARVAAEATSVGNGAATVLDGAEPATVIVLDHTAPAAQPPPGPPDVDEFKDLLGQAVGLRLDSVSREFGGRNETHVAALREVTLDVGPCGRQVTSMAPGCRSASCPIATCRTTGSSA